MKVLTRMETLVIRVRPMKSRERKAKGDLIEPVRHKQGHE
jgi:hypothetical protein